SEQVSSASRRGGAHSMGKVSRRARPSPHADGPSGRIANVSRTEPPARDVPERAARTSTSGTPSFLHSAPDLVPDLIRRSLGQALELRRLDAEEPPPYVRPVARPRHEDRELQGVAIALDAS